MNVGFRNGPLPSVLILAPCYQASWGPARDSAVNFAANYSKNGGDISIVSGWRSSSLPEVRTLLTVEIALKRNVDVILWLDDDMQFFAEQATTLIIECLRRKTIVGALYRSRSETHKIVCEGIEPVDYVTAAREKLQSVHWIGFGLTAMPLQTLELMFKKYGRNMFRFVGEEGEIISPKDNMFGEDVAFCRNWKALGHDIFVHTDVKIGHIGPTIFKIES